MTSSPSASSRYGGTMAEHPDIAEMRERYERISATPPAVVVDGLLLLAGLWLAISPWVIRFNDTAPNVRINNLILGIGVAVVALGLTTQSQVMVRLSWATALIGVWVIVSPWVIQRSAVDAGIILNNVITGGVITLAGLVAAAMVMGSRATASRRLEGRRT